MKIIWPYILISYAALFAFGLGDNIRGPAYPEILKTFNLDNDRGAMIFSLTSLAGLFITLTSRWWLSKIGIMRSMMAGLLLMFLSSILFGSTQFLSYGHQLIFAVAFLSGIGANACSLVMNILVTRASPLHMRRRTLSGLHSVYGIASLLAPLVYTYTMRFTSHWGVVFILLSFLPLFILIATFLAKAPEIRPKERKPMRAPCTLLKRLPYGIAFGLYVAAEVLVSSRLVLFLQQHSGLAEPQSHYYLSIFFVCLMAGRILFAVVPTPGSHYFWMTLSLLISLSLLWLGFHYHPICFALSGFSMSMFYPVSMELLGEHFEDGLEYMTGSVQAFMGIMLVVGHQLFGMVAKNWGLRAAFSLSPAFFVGSMFFLFLIWFQNRPNATVRTPPVSHLP